MALQSLSSHQAVAEDFSWTDVNRQVKLVKIPFADQYCQRILCLDIWSKLKSLIDDSLLLSLSTAYKKQCAKHIEYGCPASLPTGLLQKNLKELNSSDYRIFEKTDGQRFLLCFLTQDDKRLCFAINRSNQYHLLTIQMAGNGDIFKCTIFDGELIQLPSGKHEFQIFDCLFANGTCLVEEKYEYRHKIATSMCPSFSMYEAKNPFKIRVKESISSTRMAEIYHDTSTVPYKIDGFILVNAELPYIIGPDDYLLKYKFYHTMDFYTTIVQDLKDRKIKYQFNVTSVKKQGNSTGMNMVQTGLVDDAWLSSFKDIDHKTVSPSSMESLAIFDNVIIECAWSKESRMWKPEKIRSDKDFANNQTTLDRTMTNVQENIPFKTVLKWFNPSV
jgi:hypothetical protein